MKWNGRNAAFAGCVGLFGILATATIAMGQASPPPDNCHCGPVNDCHGIPLSASAYCEEGESCACIPDFHPTQNCIVGLDAVCYVPN